MEAKKALVLGGGGEGRGTNRPIRRVFLFISVSITLGFN